MSALNAFTTTELLDANNILLAARRFFRLQAVLCHSVETTRGGHLHQWAGQHLQALDEEIFRVVMEMDSRDLTGDSDAQLERDIAIRESLDILPIEVPFSVVVKRGSAS